VVGAGERWYAVTKGGRGRERGRRYVRSRSRCVLCCVLAVAQHKGKAQACSSCKRTRGCNAARTTRRRGLVFCGPRSLVVVLGGAGLFSWPRLLGEIQEVARAEWQAAAASLDRCGRRGLGLRLVTRLAALCCVCGGGRPLRLGRYSLRGKQRAVDGLR
jgi:hypothetical protein